MTPMRRFSLIVLCGMSFALAQIGAASAQGLKFGLRPDDPKKGYFQYTLAQGANVSDAILAVNNSTNEAVSLIVTNVDGYTGLTGGISFDNKPATTIGKWITIPDGGARVNIPASKSARFPFVVNVPPNTPAGEYIAGIMAYPADEVEAINAGGGMSVKVVPQAAVTVVITVTGNTPIASRMTIEKIDSAQDASGQLLTKILLRNSGNAGWKGKGELVITSGASGANEATRQTFNIGYVIGGSSLIYPLYTAPINDGNYQAEVKLFDDKGATITTNTSAIKVGKPLSLPAISNPQPQQNTNTSGVVQAAGQGDLFNRTTIIVFVLVFALVMFGVVVFLMFRPRSNQ